MNGFDLYDISPSKLFNSEFDFIRMMLILFQQLKMISSFQILHRDIKPQSKQYIINF